MKGDSLPNAAPVFGTRTVETTTNDPGARIVYSTWKDLAGNLWLFGSGNYYLNEYRNDLWKYNIVTNNWTWMNGANTTWQNGNYGVQCSASTANTPGYRLENRAHWTDTYGNFWMMGGGNGAGIITWNDLWTYCVSSNEWTWVDNSGMTNPTGNWGTLGVSAPANQPNGRCAAVGWSDQLGHLYFFGGTDNTFYDFYNDLWMYTIDTTCANQGCNYIPVTANFFSNPNVICPGTCIDFTNISFGAISYQWFFPGGAPGLSTDVNPSGICYNLPGSYDVTLIATNANGTDTLTLVNYINVHSYPPAQGILQSGDTLFANPGAVTYQWYFNGNVISGATEYYYVAAQSGDFNVVCTDSNDCEVEAVINDVTAGISDVSVIPELTISPNPVISNIGLQFREPQNSKAILRIFNSFGESVFENEISLVNQTFNISELSQGIYTVSIRTDQGIWTEKIVK